MKNFIREFKEFAVRGNVIDLAVGIIIGAAFNRIVSSLVSDIIMPPIGLLLKRVDFANLYLNLSGGKFSTLSEAQAAGAVTLNYGLFINVLISFVITAFAVFLLVRWINRIRQKQERGEQDAAATTKACPFCFSSIPVKATRCPNCTSHLENAHV